MEPGKLMMTYKTIWISEYGRLRRPRGEDACTRDLILDAWGDLHVTVDWAVLRVMLKRRYVLVYGTWPLYQAQEFSHLHTAIMGARMLEL